MASVCAINGCEGVYLGQLGGQRGALITSRNAPLCVRADKELILEEVRFARELIDRKLNAPWNGPVGENVFPWKCERNSDE